VVGYSITLRNVPHSGRPTSCSGLIRHRDAPDGDRVIQTAMSRRVRVIYGAFEAVFVANAAQMAED
jgi:hypothetical protein